MSLLGRGTLSGGDYRTFLIPGMFAMAMAFRPERIMVSVSSHAVRGPNDRVRSTLMLHSAVVIDPERYNMLQPCCNRSRKH